MKPKKFNIDDKVFAKVKGYPAWPAIITHINKSTYSVLFYGTAEVGACKPQDLYYYLKHREKFLKNQKRQEYLDAIEEMDIAIAECGGIDGSTESANVSTASISDASFSSNTDEGGSKKRSSESKTVQPKKKHSAAATKRRKRGDSASADDNDREGARPNENSPAVEPQPLVLNKSSSNASRTEQTLTIGDIKVVTVEYLQTVRAYWRHVRNNPVIYKRLPMEKRYSKPNELLLVKTKAGNLVGIKYNRDIEECSTSEYARAEYEDAEVSTIFHMKAMLENGQILPEEDLAIFETNLDVTETQIQESIELALIQSKKHKLDWLKVENKLAELDTEIKKHLGLEQAKPEMAKKLLREMLDLKIEVLMLLKHPSVFDMAKRLRRYVGNVQEWNYTIEEREQFDTLASHVRENADAVYKKFVAVLQYTGDEDPWDYYLEQVARFKEQVIDMVECNVFALTAPPTSRATFFDNMEDEEELKEMVDKLGKNKMTSTVHLQI